MILIFRYLGFLLFVASFFQAIPVATALLHGESVFFNIISFSISFFVGLIMILATHGKRKSLGDLRLKSGMILAALSFIILPLIGAISFLPHFDYNFLNAYFESVSGFTTTGLTLFDSLDSLPKGLLMWRAETQWMGGIGIILFFLFLITRVNLTKESASNNSIVKKNRSSMALYKAQGFSEKFESSLKHTLKRVMVIYIGFTLFGIALLYFFGTPIFDSIAITFTSISTGGFSVSDTFYSNDIQLIIISILMLIGAISFVSHNRLLKLQFKRFLYDYEKNILILFIILAVGVSFVVLPDIKLLIFQMISAFTTTGFSTTAIALLPQLVIFLLMIGMIVGGSSASTSGGIKVSRIYYLFRSIPWYIRKKSLPEHAVVPLNVHDEVVDTQKLVGISIYIITYMTILFIGTVIFMLFGFSFLDSSFQITSALGTVGLQTMDLMVLTPLLKSILIVAMIFGRLEIFPLLIAFKSIFKKV